MAHETFFESIWKHGLKSKYIQKVLNSDPVQNWVKGTTGSGLTNAEIQQNEWNAVEAQKNRDWQEQMDATKYQRQTADMAAAGLNPAVMYGGSAGASSLSGSAASGGDAGTPSGGLVNSVLDIIFAKQRLNNLKAEGRNIETQSEKNEADADLARSSKELTDTNVRLQSVILDYYPKLSQANLDKIAEEIKKIGSDIDVNRSVVDLNDANKELAEAKKDIEVLNKEWLPKINDAKTKKDIADAVKAYADAAWQKYFKEFAETHAGVTPGRDLWTGFAATLADSISHVVDDVNEFVDGLIPDWLRKKDSKDSDQDKNKGNGR